MTESANVVHTLAAELRDAILRGAFQPGDRLPAERELAARHSVNRASVREALKRLEQLGLVDIRRGGGARVCRLDEANVEVIAHLLYVDGRFDPALALQILDVIQILVAGAARLALERASTDELVEASQLLERLVDAGADIDARLAALDALYELITRASENLLLQMIYNSIRPALHGQLGHSLCGALFGSRDQVQRHFEGLEAAILARDPARLEAAIHALQDQSRERLREILALVETTPKEDGPSAP